MTAVVSTTYTILTLLPEVRSYPPLFAEEMRHATDSPPILADEQEEQHEDSGEQQSQGTIRSLKPAEDFLAGHKLQELYIHLNHLLGKQLALLNLLKLIATGIESGISLSTLFNIARSLSSQLSRLSEHFTTINQQTKLTTHNKHQLHQQVRYLHELKTEINSSFGKIVDRKSLETSSVTAPTPSLKIR